MLNAGRSDGVSLQVRIRARAGARPARLAIAGLIGLTVVGVACAPGPPPESVFGEGPAAESSFDGLTRVDNGAMDAVWVREGIDLSGYRQVMLQGIGIEFRPVRPSSGMPGARGPFPLSDSQKEQLVDVVRRAFVEELGRSDRFSLTDAPGPDVLLVRGGLLDVVSNVPPPSAQRQEIYLDRIGEATLVLEVRDAETGAILVRAVDREAAEDVAGRLTRAGSVQTWGEVRRVADAWAQQLRRGLERLAGTAR